MPTSPFTISTGSNTVVLNAERNWNVTHAWCGFRTGSTQPNPCQAPTGPIITPREFLTEVVTEVVTETPTPTP